MGKPSQEFDRQLFTLKLSQLSNQMQKKSVTADTAAQTNGDNPYFPDIWSRSSGEPSLMRMVNGQLALLNEWLRGIDGIAREVWVEIQGEALTPEFVRDILVPEAMTVIGARHSTVSANVTSAATRGRDTAASYPAQHRLVVELARIKAEVSARYEIEARELEYRNRESDPVGWRFRGEECKKLATEETQIIIATRKERLFADCRFADSRLTFDKESVLKLREGPDLRLKVEYEVWATKAGIALGSPKDASPLRFWLYQLFLYLYKTKSPHLFAPESSYTVGPNPQSELLKPQAGQTVFRIGGIITNVWEASATFCIWLEKLALEAQHKGAVTDRLKPLSELSYVQPTENREHNARTWLVDHGIPPTAETLASLVQKNEKTTQRTESAPGETTTIIGRNINRLRKECGWSLHDLSRETGVDKKLILSHLNKGARPRPRILREYAQAFSKKLGRNITAPDLEVAGQ